MHGYSQGKKRVVNMLIRDGAGRFSTKNVNNRSSNGYWDGIILSGLKNRSQRAEVVRGGPAQTALSEGKKEDA
jgi:hypothetical protein